MWCLVGLCFFHSLMQNIYSQLPHDTASFLLPWSLFLGGKGDTKQVKQVNVCTQHPTSHFGLTNKLIPDKTVSLISLRVTGGLTYKASLVRFIFF